MRRARGVIALAAALGAGCSTTAVGRATTAFPTAWSDEADWQPNMKVGGALPATPVPAPTPTVKSAPTNAARGLVVVLPLDAGSANLDKGTYTALDEYVRTIAGEALSPHGYTVLTGETTLAVLQDNGVDLSKACEASCALQTARELKAQLFVSGSIAKSEGAYIAFVRLFDSTNGRQLAAVSLEGETVRSLREAFAKKAETFFAKVTQTP